MSFYISQGLATVYTSNMIGMATFLLGAVLSAGLLLYKRMLSREQYTIFQRYSKIILYQLFVRANLLQLKQFPVMHPIMWSSRVARSPTETEVPSTVCSIRKNSKKYPFQYFTSNFDPALYKGLSYEKSPKHLGKQHLPPTFST